MNCEETDELLAAYSLAALADDEAAAVRAHLATCRRHDASLAELASVAERLPLAVDDVEPPAALRSRLLDAFDLETGARRATPARRLAILRPRLALLAAAAVLVLALTGMVAWNLTLQLGGDGDETVVVEFDSGAGRLVYVEHAGLAVMELSLPEPAPSREYQAWGIYDEGPVSLGLVPHKGIIALTADLTGASAIAISEEPAGGSEQPTTEPLLVAMLP